MSQRERTVHALQDLELDDDPEAIRWYEMPMDRRIAKIREALGQILWASFSWNNEVRTELAKMSEEERLDFAETAGRAMGELGDFIAAAVGGPR